jgi:hypothetical protein
MNNYKQTKMLELMRAGPRFLSNFNIMLFIEMFIVLLTAILKIIELRLTIKNLKFEKVCKYLSGFCLSFVVFNSLNTGFSLGMEIKNSSKPSFNA